MRVISLKDYDSKEACTHCRFLQKMYYELVETVMHLIYIQKPINLLINGLKKFDCGLNVVSLYEF